MKLSTFMAPLRALYSLLFLLVTLNVFGQVSTGYTFSEDNVTYSELTGATTIFSSGWDDNIPATVNLPFTFYFNNIPYTQVSVNPNGYITFGTTISDRYVFSPISNSTAYDGAISALGIDLQSNSNSSNISHRTLGSGNSRIFVIQWKDAKRYNVNGPWNFQIRLHEGSNIIRIVYGNCSPETTTSVNVQVGLRGFLNSDWNNRRLDNNYLWAGNTVSGDRNNRTVRTRSNAYPETDLNFIYTPFVPSPATLDYVDDFEGINNWIIPNGRQTNKWWVGNVVNNGGSRSLYISSNTTGSTHAYNQNIASVVHAYRTITIPSGTNEVGIYFDWRANGDAAGNDYLRTWLVPGNYYPIPGQEILPGGGRILLNEKLNLNNNWTTQYNEHVDVSSFAGSNMRLVFEWKNNESGNGQQPAAIDNVRVLRYCYGTPNGGTATITPATGLPSSAFTINVVGNTLAAGILNQWQIAENAAGPWTDISGATTENLTSIAVPLPSTTRYYRRKVICTATNQESFSNVVSFTTTTPTYCLPTVTNPNGLFISKVAIIGTMADPPINYSGAGTNGTGYSNFTGLTTIAQQAQGEGVNVIASVGGSVFGRGTWKAWVDWNGNGVFNDPGEEIYNIYGWAGAVANMGFVVPVNQQPGNYRMRIRVNNGITWLGEESFGFNFNPCDNFTDGTGFNPRNGYGETEDYLVKVVANCSAKITSITNSSECKTSAGVEVELKATSSEPVTEFRWYESLTATTYSVSSPDGTGMGTTFTTNALNGSKTYYVTAFNGVCESTFRVPVLAEIKPTPDISFTPSTLEVCGTPSVVAVSATGSKEIVHLVNENFESGTWGAFTNVNGPSDTNGTAIDNLTRFQNRTSVFKPNANVWFPAISSGFGGNKFVMASSDVLATLTSPVENSLTLSSPVSTIGLDNLTLKLRMYYSRYLPDNNEDFEEYIAIEVTTENTFNNATQIVKFVSSQGEGSNFKTLTYDLSAFIGQPNLRFRIRHFSWSQDGGFLPDGVAVDDIELFGEKPLEPSFTWTSTNPIGVYTNSEATIEYTGGPISTLYIKPTQDQLETLSDWSISATATLSNACNAVGTINITNNTKLWDIASSDWNTSNWKPVNSIPTENHCVIVRKPVSLLAGNNGLAKNIHVEPTGNLTIKSDASLTVTDEIVNSGLEDNIVVENGANLLQINPLAENVGGIKVQKLFTFVDGIIPANDRKQYNYVISPVIGQNLKGIYGYNTNPTIIIHNEATNFFHNFNGAYLAGRGLAIKEPSKENVPMSTLTANFKGIPFNGTLSYPLKYTINPEVSPGFNLIGNPYPSNLDIEAMYDANASLMEATFLFWDNRGNVLYTQEGSNYTGDNYAKYNAITGSGVGVGYAAEGAPDETRIPNRYVKVGTAFMVRALPTANGQSIQFNNTFRTVNNSGPIFFGKGKVIDGLNDEGNNGGMEEMKDRYWLSLETPSNMEFMNAVVYFEAGKDEFWLDDTETFGGSNDIYSVVDNYELAIQGKSSFVNTDRVPLGIRTFDTGIHRISILNTEGIFANGQTIYIHDKMRNIIHDLSGGPYEFKAIAGQTNNRFEIIYKRNHISASSSSWLKNEVEVKKRNQEIQISSSLDKISDIEIFSLTSKSLYKKENANQNEIRVPLSLFGKEIVIVNVVTEKGERISKKFIVN